MQTFKFEQYRYEALPSGSSIRLLVPVTNRVNPNEPKLCGNRLLQFRIEVADLNNPPTFECLSYTNGDPIWRSSDDTNHEYDFKSKWPVAVNNRLAFISKNLFEALSQLHPLGEPAPRVDDRLPDHGRNKTSLIRESELGHHHRVSQLVAQGADLRAQDVFGETALHYAAENGHLATVKVLLNAGADLHVVDNVGRTPIDCALQSKRRQHTEVASFMTSYSTTPTELDSSQSTTATRLWVDCLCINSSDLQERNSQVSMMNIIYREAFRVIIWLGRDDHTSSTQRVQNLTKDFKTSAFTSAIDDIMKRSYFHRVWTVQELAVAQDIAMYCGSQELVSLNPIILPYIALCVEIKNRGILVDGGGLRIFLDQHIDRYQQQIRTIAPAIDLHMASDQSQPFAWTTLLAITWNHDATDTRDKIYALFGLASPLTTDSKFTVDYSRSKADLFLQVGRHFIAGDPLVRRRLPPVSFTTNLGSVDRAWDKLSPGDVTGGPLAPLDGLSYVQKALWKHQGLDIPSWCPDFGLHLRAQPMDYMRFNATSGMIPNIDFDHDRLLVTEAAMFDTIVDAQNAYSYAIPLVDNVKNWAYMTSTLKHDYPTGETRVAALIRTVIRDTDRHTTEERRHNSFPYGHHERRAWNVILDFLADNVKKSDIPHDAYELLPELKEKLKRRPDYGYTNFRNGVAQLNVHRCLFTTAKGYLGLGLNKATKRGDHVCLLAGAHVPHILRPLKAQDDGRLHYEFMGDSYVHGIMFGEALESGELEFKQIAIH